MNAEQDPAQGMRRPGPDPDLAGEIAIDKRRSNHGAIVMRNLAAHIVDPTPPSPGDHFPTCPRRRAPALGSHRFDKVKEPPRARAADVAAGS